MNFLVIENQGSIWVRCGAREYAVPESLHELECRLAVEYVLVHETEPFHAILRDKYARRGFISDNTFARPLRISTRGASVGLSVFRRPKSRWNDDAV